MNKQFLEDIITEKNKKKVIGQYGISFLDEYLLGILEEDFVLIGADTGLGKSELAYDIAFKNAADKKVHLFALEAEINEPYYRRLFKNIAKVYYEDPDRIFLDMNYRNYLFNQIDVSKYEKIAIENMQIEEDSSLTIHYRSGEFTINTLLQTIAKVKDSCELVVLDHVDYMDLHLSENENSQVTKIMKTLRDINQVYKIPIIVISHLRKKGNKKQLVPSLDDFFGSGNKSKQVKTAILLAKDYERENYKEGLYSTFVTVGKARVGGTTSLAARCIFDVKVNKYLDTYDLVRVKNFGETVEVLDYEDYPSWAKQHAKKARF